MIRDTTIALLWHHFRRMLLDFQSTCKIWNPRRIIVWFIVFNIQPRDHIFRYWVMHETKPCFIQTTSHHKKGFYWGKSNVSENVTSLLVAIVLIIIFDWCIIQKLNLINETSSSNRRIFNTSELIHSILWPLLTDSWE